MSSRPVPKGEILVSYLRSLPKTALGLECDKITDRTQAGKDPISQEEWARIIVAKELEHNVQMLVLMRHLGLNNKPELAGKIDLERSAIRALASAYEQVTLQGQSFVVRFEDADRMAHSVAAAADPLAASYARRMSVSIGGHAR